MGRNVRFLIYLINKSLTELRLPRLAETKPEAPPVPKLTDASKEASASTSTAPTAEKKPEASKELADFFSSIEQEQTNMFANQPSG